MNKCCRFVLREELAYINLLFGSTGDLLFLEYKKCSFKKIKINVRCACNYLPSELKLTAVTFFVFSVSMIGCSKVELARYANIILVKKQKERIDSICLQTV